MSGDWWSQRYERDYYCIDWAGGERAWVFHDLIGKQWYLHGLFD